MYRLYKIPTGKKHHITNRHPGEVGRTRSLCGVKVFAHDIYLGEVDPESPVGAVTCLNCLRELKKELKQSTIGDMVVPKADYQELKSTLKEFAERYDNLKAKYDHLRRNRFPLGSQSDHRGRRARLWEKQYYDLVKETTEDKKILKEINEKLLLCIEERDNLYTLLMYHANQIRRR